MIDLNAVRDGLAHFGSLNMEAVKQAGERFNREVDAHIKRAEPSTKAQRPASRLRGATTDYVMWDDWHPRVGRSLATVEGVGLDMRRPHCPSHPAIRMGLCAALEGAGWRWRGRIEGSGTAEGV